LVDRKDASPEIRQTLRHLKIRRDTSRMYGLRDDAFVDLRELVAMLREQLRDQTERYDESLELSRQVSDIAKMYTLLRCTDEALGSPLVRGDVHDGSTDHCPLTTDH